MLSLRQKTSGLALLTFSHTELKAKTNHIIQLEAHTQTQHDSSIKIQIVYRATTQTDFMRIVATK
jgi:hypothetical protein